MLDYQRVPLDVASDLIYDKMDHLKMGHAHTHVTKAITSVGLRGN